MDITIETFGSKRSWSRRDPGVLIEAKAAVISPDRNPSRFDVTISARFLGGEPPQTDDDALVLLHVLVDRLRQGLPPIGLGRSETPDTDDC